MAGDREENAIAVDDFPGFTNKEGAVGVAIEGNSKLSAIGEHAFLQPVEMERAAPGVDVAAVGRNSHGDDFCPKRAEEFGAKLVRGTVGTVEKDAETGKFGSGNDTTAKKIEIFGVERRIGDKKRRIFRRRIGPVLEDVRFQSFFDGVRELHARVREKLYAVVVVGIVRGGDNDTGLEIILSDEAGDARSGDDAGKSDGRTGVREAGGEEGGDVRAGFASVHADENVSGGVFAEKIASKSAASGKKSGVVERRRPGNAANTIGSKEFFGHERLAIIS